MMAQLTGTSANENIDGSFEPDTIHGEAGDDKLYGHDNDDTLYGDDGADTLFGGAGNDTLYGGDGADTDTLYGGAGDDSLHAKGGDTADGGREIDGTVPDQDALYVDSLDHLCGLRPDAEGNGYDGQVVLDGGGVVNFANIGVLYVAGVVTAWPDFIVEGSEGADTIDDDYEDDPEGDKVNHEDNQLCNNDDLVEAYGGDDQVTSGDGNDTIYAGTGDDTVHAGDDNDRIYGEAGNDTLHGDAGNDDVDGGSGQDTLYGDTGEDTLDGGTGEDVLFGGTGADDLTGGSDNDILFGGAGNDVADGESGDDQIEGGIGEDDLSGGLGKDTIDGGADADKIDGEEGADLLYGGGGDDTLLGGAGNDVAYGGQGDDTLELGADNDIGIGGAGDDTLQGGDGNDCLFGDEPESVTISPGAIQGQGIAGSTTGNISGMPENEFTLGMQFNGAMVPTPPPVPGNDDDGDEATQNSPPDSVIPNTTTLLSYGTPGTLTISAQSDVEYFNYPQPNTLGSGETNDSSTTTIPGHLVIQVATVGGGSEAIETDILSSTVLSGTNTSLAVTFSGDEIQIFLNGVEHSTSFNTNNAFDLPADGAMTFGNSSSGDNGFTGEFSDIRLWGDVRTDAEITEFSNADLEDEAGNPDLISNWVPDPFNPGGFIDAPGGNGATGFGPTQFNSIGAGSDTINGGAGDDKIFGASGDDILFGDAGNDVIYAGQDNDADKIDGGDDRDYIYAGPGDEVKGGQSGDDFDTLDVSSFVEAGGYAQIDPTTAQSDANSGGNGNGQDGTINFYDADSNLTGSLVFEDIENFEGVAPCFTPGTLIVTPKGEIPVEQLNVGDRVLTKDNGFQQIEWIGSKKIAGAELAANPNLQPVLIEQGALGFEQPGRDTIVSPQHRMLVGNTATQVWFGEAEVLVAAKHLTCLDQVTGLKVDEVEYIHFMFKRHEVVCSNGAWSESFQPGDATLGALEAGARQEILSLFPELSGMGGANQYAAARPSLKGYEAEVAFAPI